MVIAYSAGGRIGFDRGDLRLWVRRGTDDTVDAEEAGMRALDRTYAAVVFDWDGTAVPDRRASARRLRTRLERLSGLGVHAVVVSGTHVGNVDGQLQARPAGPGELLLALNRGSELFRVTETGPRLLNRRVETEANARLLDRAATTVAAALRDRGLPVEIVSHRINRRKIDLIPEPAWADPPKAEIDRLVVAVGERVRRAGLGSLAEVVALATELARECGIADPRVTSDAKHVEVGLTDKADSMRAVLRCLDDLGVGADLVLVAGDEFGDLGGVPGSDSLLLVPEAEGATFVSVGREPAGVPVGVRHLGGGPTAFVGLLDGQIARARALRVPAASRDPTWTIVETGIDIARHAVSESLFTLTSGGVGLRGSVEETPEFGRPLVVASGVYVGPAVGDGLLAGPDVLDVVIDPAVEEDVRILDLRTGVLSRQETAPDGAPLRSLRFGSLLEPGVFAMRVEGGRGRLRTRRAVPKGWREVRSGGAGIGAAVRQSVRRGPETTAVERLVATDFATHRAPGRDRADERVARAAETGFERLLCGQRATWARRWRSVGVDIPDDPETELALRFALFHLWGVTGDGRRELAVGARGLTGNGYAGHVFWDADAFVLPALVTIDPAAAAAMVRYRLQRLGAARARACADGHRGARFPWESAREGTDVTPSVGYVGAEQVAILTGRMEEHITADVAWAVVRNAAWSRRRFLLTPSEGELLADTARYWQSRIRCDAERTGHIDGVIGPDEYHEDVDDNAFTNGMARWNLEAAARWAPATEEERQGWRETARRLVDGYDPATGLYEQFRGYFTLEPLLVTDLAPPPMAADVLAGRDRINHSQVVKQPDVLMLHHLVPEQTVPGSLAANLDFYGPRTAHGSSLSQAVVAGLEARAGRPDRALELLRASLRIDLDDVGGTTAAGVHIGACGGAWQAFLSGFLGAAVHDGALHLAPALPDDWPRLEARFRCLGSDVRVRVDPTALSVDASAPLRVHLEAGDRRTVIATSVENV
jgi:trehalose/maltose hydrolase-like predicted phosphorylase/hydroxymethylpyrimidine pyrophosphatase-like HAD family hydrolase